MADDELYRLPSRPRDSATCQAPLTPTKAVEVQARQATAKRLPGLLSTLAGDRYDGSDDPRQRSAGVIGTPPKSTRRDMGPEAFKLASKPFGSPHTFLQRCLDETSEDEAVSPISCESDRSWTRVTTTTRHERKSSKETILSAYGSVSSAPSSALPTPQSSPHLALSFAANSAALSHIQAGPFRDFYARPSAPLADNGRDETDAELTDFAHRFHARLSFPSEQAGKDDLERGMTSMPLTRPTTMAGAASYVPASGLQAFDLVAHWAYNNAAVGGGARPGNVATTGVGAGAGAEAKAILFSQSLDHEHGCGYGHPAGLSTCHSLISLVRPRRTRGKRGGAKRKRRQQPGGELSLAGDE